MNVTGEDHRVGHFALNHEAQQVHPLVGIAGPLIHGVGHRNAAVRHANHGHHYLLGKHVPSAMGLNQRLL